MSYFWITSNEGGTTLRKLSEEEVAAEIKGRTEDGWSLNFLAGIPEDDGGYWMGLPDRMESVLLIKGEIIQPKAVERVTEYEL